MIHENSLPFECHVFVCTHTRNGESKACLDGNSSEVRDILKAEVKKLGLNSRVRVSQSGCLGLCASGPNIVIYPQKIWFAQVDKSDIPEILETIKGLVG